MELIFFPELWGFLCGAGIVLFILWLFWYFFFGGKEEIMNEEFRIIEEQLRAREEDEMRALMLEKLRKEHGERERDSSR